MWLVFGAAWTGIGIVIALEREDRLRPSWGAP